MTSPNTIIADMQAVETNLLQQIAHLNDEIAGLKSDVAFIEKQRDAWKEVAEHHYGLMRTALYGTYVSEYPVTGALDYFAAGRHPVLKSKGGS